MVYALGSSPSGLGQSPSRGHCVVFLGKYTVLSQCLSPPGCRVPANLRLGEPCSELASRSGWE